MDSCVDCFAWGATRHRGWRCIGCDRWHRTRTVGDCEACRRTGPLNEHHLCRLCVKQRGLVIARDGWRPDLRAADACRDGHQLFLADLFHPAARGRKTGPGARTAAPPPPPPDREWVRIRDQQRSWRQLRLFDSLRLIPTHRGAGDPDSAPVLQTALLAYVDEHAERHGWSSSTRLDVRAGVRLLLRTQDDPAVVIRATAVLELRKVGISAPGVLTVLEAAGMLDDDREPALVCWCERQLATLPAPMAAELRVWIEVMQHGSASPPRRRPRSHATIRAQLGFAMPVLQSWARDHSSLREITRDAVVAVLPPAGVVRSTRLQALRSIFRILKAQQQVFINPTAWLRAPTPDRPVPPPVNLNELRDALTSDDPTRALLAALLAFHAIRISQLRRVQLCDIVDGRLQLPTHTVVLGEPVRERLRNYLDGRTRRWPATANPHLLIHGISALGIAPVSAGWISKRLGMSAMHVRQDRLLDEAHATAADLRQLIELFGLSASGAHRYTRLVGVLDRKPFDG